MTGKLKVKQTVVGPIGTNCYLVMNEETKELFAVDPGDEGERLISEIREMGGVPKAILLTHGHTDHIMGVMALRAGYPDLRIFAGEREKRMLSDPSVNSGFERRPYDVRPDVWLEDDRRIVLAGTEIEVLATPGHTEGSVCYYLPEEKLLFSGDTLFRESYGRTDLPTGSDEEMEASLHKIFASVPEDVRVCPGHMGLTTIGHEKEFNPGA
jgi:hydroxyacylglutathione hydrolase